MYAVVCIVKSLVTGLKSLTVTVEFYYEASLKKDTNLETSFSAGWRLLVLMSEIYGAALLVQDVGPVIRALDS